MPTYKWLIPVSILLLAACAAPEPLSVHSHTVRDQSHDDERDDPMGRNEKLRRLHGAVSMEERKNLLGQYYTIRWNDEAVAKGPVTVVFEYQQGATGSRVKSIRSEFPADLTSGTAEVSVIGEDYFQGGRVLAWRATLLRGNETIATRRSYLWQ